MVESLVCKTMHGGSNPPGTSRKEDTGEANFLLNAFSDFFNNINNVREDIEKTSHRMLVINKVMLRKLSKL